MTASPQDAVAPWRGRFMLYAVGVVMIGFGLRGILADTNGWTHPLLWFPLVVVFAVGHDLVLVPLVFAVAAMLGRLTGPSTRSLLAAGLGISGVLAVLALPGIRRAGERPDNPSVLPVDYVHGLLIALVLLWLGLLLVFLVRAVQAERAIHRRQHGAG